MKVNQSQLAAALVWPVRIGWGHSDTPAYLRLSADGVMMKIEASDAEQSCVELLQCDGELEPICVSPSTFNTIVGFGGDSVELEVKNGQLFYTSGGRVMKIPTVAADAYSGLKADGTAYGIPCGLLADGLEAVAPFQCMNESRYILQCVHVSTSASQIVCEAGDGQQYARFLTAAIAADLDLLVPREFVSAAVNALRREAAEIRVGTNLATITHAHGSYTFKQLEGKFPNTAAQTGAARSPLGLIPRDEWLEAFNCVRLLRTGKEDKMAMTKVGLSHHAALIEAVAGVEYSQTIEGKFTPFNLTLNAITFHHCLSVFPDASLLRLEYIADFKAVSLSEGDLMVITTQIRA